MIYKHAVAVQSCVSMCWMVMPEKYPMSRKIGCSAAHEELTAAYLITDLLDIPALS